jgi:hypothetical protein
VLEPHYLVWRPFAMGCIPKPKVTPNDIAVNLDLKYYGTTHMVKLQPLYSQLFDSIKTNDQFIKDFSALQNDWQDEGYTTVPLSHSEMGLSVDYGDDTIQQYGALSFLAKNVDVKLLHSDAILLIHYQGNVNPKIPVMDLNQ